MASDIPETPLQSPYLKGGIQRVSWWNGRVLTAEDMRDLQLATDRGDRQLAEVLGEGVADGFAVSREPDGRTIRVTPGRAVNRAGEVLTLDHPLRVPLVAAVGAAAPARDAAFAACADVPPTVTPVGTGIYLLTVGSATGKSGSAPAVSADRAVAADCGPRYTITGVQFRLVELDVVALAEEAGHDEDDLEVLRAAPNTPGRRLLRNVVAHLFLGTVAIHRHVADPVGGHAQTGRSGYGPVDALHEEGHLTDCDVPLALVSWSDALVEFVDMYAVRRPPGRRGHPVPAWANVVARRRRAESEAALLQFQDHVNAVLGPDISQATLSAIVAGEHFRYLPPAGLLPTFGLDGSGGRGFFLDNFLGAPPTPVELSVPDAERLLRESFNSPAVDFRESTLSLYTVDPTAEPATPDPSTPRPFVLFSPFEFVRAQDVAQLRDRVGVLEGQVTALLEVVAVDETQIFSVFPTGPVELGQRIEVRGRNFGVSAGFARVFFDDTRTDPLPGSTDDRLLVDVPETLTVPEAGADVDLTVTNATDSDSVRIRVQRRHLPLSGSIDVLFQQVEPAPIEAHAPADFRYEVVSRLSRTAGVLVNVEFDPPLTGLSLLNADGTPVARNTVTLQPSSRAEITVHVEEMPAEDTSFTLTVVAVAGTIEGAHTDIFAVGAAPDPDDPDVDLRFDQFRVQSEPPGQSGSISGNTISLTTGSLGDIVLIATLRQSGDHDVTVDIDPAANWIAVVSQPGDGVIEVGDVSGGPAASQVVVTVGPGEHAAPHTEVIVGVQREDATLRTRRTYLLQLAS